MAVESRAQPAYPPLRLRAMRVARGITTRAIAKALGLSESRVRQAEREIASPVFADRYISALAGLCVEEG